MTAQDFVSGVQSYPEGIQHFATIRPCIGIAAKPCNIQMMLECKYCPWTRLKVLAPDKELPDKEFTAWKNPLACRDIKEIVIDRPARLGMAKGHVEGPRGWHQFWYAVHSLYPQVASGAEDGGGPPGDLQYPQVAGGAAAGGGAAGVAAGGGRPPGDRQLMMEWFAKKAKDYRARGNFERAGLLEPGGAGATYGIIDKFSMADRLFQAYPDLRTPPKSRSVAAPHPPDDEGESAEKRVKLEVHSQQQAPASHAPEQISRAVPVPAAGGNGMGSVAGYNSKDVDVSLQSHQKLQHLCTFWDPFQQDPQQGSSSGAAGGSAAGAYGAASQPVPPPPPPPPPAPPAPASPPPRVHHRPVFNVFLDVMSFVTFQTEEREREWNSYNVNRDFDESLEFGLAQVIGGYLHAGELQSGELRIVLASFYQALEAPDPAGPLPYFEQLLRAPATPAVTASLTAIYSYWRIEHELLHDSYAPQLAVWQGDNIRGRLLRILGQLQQGADPASQEQGLIRFFAEADREILLRLRECGDALRYYCSNTGSFAQVVWAPRIWCFFLVLRLRHDEDFAVHVLKSHLLVTLSTGTLYGADF